MNRLNETGGVQAEKRGGARKLGTALCCGLLAVTLGLPAAPAMAAELQAAGVQPQAVAVAKTHISKAKVTRIKTQTYKGKAVCPKPKVAYQGTTLKEGVDYTLAYRGNDKGGTGTVVIIGKGAYYGMKAVRFKVNAVASVNAKTVEIAVSRSIAKASVGKIGNKTYTGKAICPKPTVKYGGKKLKNGTDYKLAYSNNKKAGTATVKITGKGAYFGTKTVKFKIVKPATTKKSTTNQSAAKSATTTGSTVTGGTAKSGATTTATTTTAAGTATSTTASKALVDIATLPAQDISLQKYDNGNPVCPDPQLKDGTKALVKNRDYLCYYFKNRKLGTATLTVRGINSAGYCGERTFEFRITKSIHDLSHASIEGKTYTYTGKAVCPSPQLKDGSTTLAKGTDYEVYYYKNTAVGTATMVVRGIGKYRDSYIWNYKIAKSSSSSSSSSSSNSGSSNTGSSTTVSAGYVDVSQCYSTLNTYRANAGLGRLARDTVLESYAQTRAKELTAKFSHTRPSGDSCLSYITQILGRGAAAENIAYGQSTQASVMSSWYNSEGHRNNMLHSAMGRVGIAGWRDSGGTIHWVQVFSN